MLVSYCSCLLAISRINGSGAWSIFLLLFYLRDQKFSLETLPSILTDEAVTCNPLSNCFSHFKISSSTSIFNESSSKHRNRTERQLSEGQFQQASPKTNWLTLGRFFRWSVLLGNPTVVHEFCSWKTIQLSNCMKEDVTTWQIIFPNISMKCLQCDSILKTLERENTQTYLLLPVGFFMKVAWSVFKQQGKLSVQLSYTPEN